MDVDDDSGSASGSSPPLFVLAEPQPSMLTAPLIAHFTALSAHSTLEQLHSVLRPPTTATAAATAAGAAAQPVPLYRLTSANAHKRQKRHQHPTTNPSSPSPAPSTPTQALTAQPSVSHVLAFSAASCLSVPLLCFVVARLCAPVLVAVVDGGQSVTVLRLQDGIVPHPSHGQPKKSTAAVAKAAQARIAAPASASRGPASTAVT